MVGDVGVEPTTSSVSTKRSTAELTALGVYYKAFLLHLQLRLKN